MKIDLFHQHPTLAVDATQEEFESSCDALGPILTRRVLADLTNQPLHDFKPFADDENWAAIKALDLPLADKVATYNKVVTAHNTALGVAGGLPQWTEDGIALVETLGEDFIKAILKSKVGINIE